MPACVRRAALLKMEEEWIQRTCEQIAAFKPDLVITGARRRMVAGDCSEGLCGVCALQPLAGGIPPPCSPRRCPRPCPRPCPCPHLSTLHVLTLRD